jgi:tetratricopeptide (TPR) repeat protein
MSVARSQYLGHSGPAAINTTFVTRCKFQRPDITDRASHHVGPLNPESTEGATQNAVDQVPVLMLRVVDRRAQSPAGPIEDETPEVREVAHEGTHTGPAPVVPWTNRIGSPDPNSSTRRRAAAASSSTKATGWREISWVQFLRAHYDRAEESPTRAAQLAPDNDEELAWAELIRGTCRSDVGDYAAAGGLLRLAIARSSRLASPQPAALARTILGRFHLLRDELEDARRNLDQALELVEERGLTAFRPWPESFRAEIDLLSGDLPSAVERFEHAFALGCQVGDPCWESIAARGLGLVAAARGEISRALELLVDAPRLCRRLPDTYLWIDANGLEALCLVAVDHGAEAAPRWLGELESIAARRGMRELLLRSTVYRARLGEPGALDAARALAGQIDNPALGKLLASVEVKAVAQ